MAAPVSLRHIRCFVAVARHGSFTLAAHRLFITQSTLTSTIRQFEEAIGVRLFNRTTRKLTLTKEGAYFLDRAETLANEFDSAIEDLKLVAKGNVGEVRLAAAPSISNVLVSKVVADFRKLNPQVSFVIREGGAEQIENLVRQGVAEIGFAENYSNLDDLSYQPIMKDQLGIVFRKCDEFTYRDIRTWAQLPQDGYIAFTPDTGVSALLERMEERPPFRDAAIQVSSTSALFSILQSSGGYAVVPFLSAQHSGGDDIVFMKLDQPVLSRDIYLITKGGGAVSPACRLFIERLLKAPFLQQDHVQGGGLSAPL